MLILFLVYKVNLIFLELIVYIVCRWLIRINQLLCRYLLGKLYNKFIHIFTTLCYKMYKKILCQFKNWIVNQQVTLAITNGTPETTRDITFNFINYLNLKVKHKKINKRFLEWFIGFTEGKGNFLVLNNKIYFNISVSIKDIQTLYYIKKELGFGKVLINGSTNNASFYVTNYNNFYRLIALFNGNICTITKLEEFKIWLNIFNNQFNKKVILIDRNLKPSYNTGWLSGFIDARGIFEGQGKKEFNNLKSPYLTFIILDNNVNDLSIINNVLNTRINKIKYNKFKNCWMISLSTVKKLKILICYLKKYKLKTSKIMIFTKWCKIYNLILNKNHLSIEGLIKIHYLLKEINKLN